MSEKNYFQELNTVNVSEHVETKGKFSYLSWAYAVAELLKRHPDATWEVKRFPMEGTEKVEVPYLMTPQGAFVEVVVTVNGIQRGQIHPVLNGQNKPIKDPSPFDINTSIQRALVKAIALHGLGLYIYAGEDLPELPPNKVKGKVQGEIVDLDKVQGFVDQALKMIDEEDEEQTPAMAKELYIQISTDERLEFQAKLKEVKYGNKMAWSIFHDYLTIAAKQEQAA